MPFPNTNVAQSRFHPKLKLCMCPPTPSLILPACFISDLDSLAGDTEADAHNHVRVQQGWRNSSGYSGKAAAFLCPLIKLDALSSELSLVPTPNSWESAVFRICLLLLRRFGQYTNLNGHAPMSSISKCFMKCSACKPIFLCKYLFLSFFREVMLSLQNWPIQ